MIPQNRCVLSDRSLLLAKDPSIAMEKTGLHERHLHLI